MNTSGLDHVHVWLTRKSGDRECVRCTATAPPRLNPHLCAQGTTHDWWTVGPGLVRCFLCGELREE